MVGSARPIGLLALLALHVLACEPAFGAHDLMPRSDRRVAVPLLPAVDPETQRPDLCDWACGPSRRAGESVDACYRVWVEGDDALRTAMGAGGGKVVLCAFR
jgi:hypothetical protein